MRSAANEISRNPVNVSWSVFRPIGYAKRSKNYSFDWHDRITIVAKRTMMAPNNTINERPEAHTQLLISISSEDEQTMPNTNQDLSDKTPNTNSQCSSMSDGESYECYGEGEIDSPPVNQLPRVEVSGVNNLSEIKRNSWLRTSLRRSTSKQNDNIAIRKWGSFRQP